jgi:hypothetical protein
MAWVDLRGGDGVVEECAGDLGEGDKVSNPRCRPFSISLPLTIKNRPPPDPLPSKTHSQQPYVPGHALFESLGSFRKECGRRFGESFNVEICMFRKTLIEKGDSRRYGSTLRVSLRGGFPGERIWSAYGRLRHGDMRERALRMTYTRYCAHDSPCTRA